MLEKRSDVTAMGGSTTQPVTVTGGGVDAAVIGVGNTEAGGVGHADTEERPTPEVLRALLVPATATLAASALGTPVVSALVVLGAPASTTYMEMESTTPAALVHWSHRPQP
jgi:hypothetical protein